MSEDEARKFCPVCGVGLAEGNFCSVCGARLEIAEGDTEATSAPKEQRADAEVSRPAVDTERYYNPSVYGEDLQSNAKVPLAPMPASEDFGDAGREPELASELTLEPGILRVFPTWLIVVATILSPIWVFYWFYVVRKQVYRLLGDRRSMTIPTISFIVPIWSLFAVYQLTRDIGLLGVRERVSGFDKSYKNYRLIAVLSTTLFFALIILPSFINTFSIGIGLAIGYILWYVVYQNIVKNIITAIIHREPERHAWTAANLIMLIGGFFLTFIFLALVLIVALVMLDSGTLA